MTTHTPRYIVIRDGVAAELYELKTRGIVAGTWTPNPLAPEYVRKATGSYTDIRSLAQRLNEQDVKLLEAQAAAVELAPAPRPKVKVKAAKIIPCLYRGCRGIAAEGQAFCPTHRPRG